MTTRTYPSGNRIETHYVDAKRYGSRGPSGRVWKWMAKAAVSRDDIGTRTLCESGFATKEEALQFGRSWVEMWYKSP